MSVEVIIGPPGTGKTTELLKIVQRAVSDGIKPGRIGFLSFSKKAAREGLSRITAGDTAQVRYWPYFQTLHSLAFKQLGLTRNRVMTGRQLHDFAGFMGLDLTFSQHFDDEMQYQAATEDDKALFVINLARIQRRNLRDAARDAELDWHLVKTLDYGLRRFKAERGLVDFTDMLERFCSEGNFQIPEFDLLCMDEAQDMSRLQWDMADKLIARSKQTFIAGDDDQAIFGWAGADTEEFRARAESGHASVLGQSYRVPVEVQRVAKRVLDRLSNRVRKEWKPRVAQGCVSLLGIFTEAPLDRGKWLILARNAYLLRPIYGYLEEQGWQGDSRISVSTIHRAKGGEADNVLLLSDTTRRTFEEIDTDDEHRVFYVAVTRARENLYIVQPQTRYYYEI